MWQNVPQRLWRRLATQMLLSSKASGRATGCPSPSCCFPSPTDLHSSFSQAPHRKTRQSGTHHNHNSIVFSPPFPHYIPDREQPLVQSRRSEQASAVESTVLRDLKHQDLNKPTLQSLTTSAKPDQNVQHLQKMQDFVHPVELKPSSSSSHSTSSSPKIQKSKTPSFLAGLGSTIKGMSSMSRNDWMKKLGGWKEDITSTLKHYGVASKLLWANVRVSSSLLVKNARGNTLTRRERQLLTTTTADMFRLVPFAIIVVVPFMELLLPLILKFFPNMLPSTFQDKVQLEQAQQKSSVARLQYANSLRDAIKEMAKEIKKTKSEDSKRSLEDLDEFMNKVRTGAQVSNADILGFAQFFNDEITLEKLSRPRLVSMCKYMGVHPYGTNAYLRYMLQYKLTCIKDDDNLIKSEGGVDSLSEVELKDACRERGMLNALSEEEMRKQLKDWLDLSLKFSVPSSLLILSRAFMVSTKVNPAEVVQATLSSLPDEVINEVGVSALPSQEDTLEENKQKLELLNKERELINMEKSKSQISSHSGQKTNSTELEEKMKIE